MKALVGDFNQEKALVGAFFVIVQLHRLIVYSTSLHRVHDAVPHTRHGPGQAAAEQAHQHSCGHRLHAS